MKKILGFGAAALAVSAAMLSPVVATAAPSTPGGLNVVGEPYGKAVQILKSQGVNQRFGGSFAGNIPQAQCIVDSQKATRQGVMLLHLDCTTKAAQNATDSQPAAPAGPAPGAGQGTYGSPVGVPVPVG